MLKQLICLMLLTALIVGCSGSVEVADSPNTGKSPNTSDSSSIGTAKKDSPAPSDRERKMTGPVGSSETKQPAKDSIADRISSAATMWQSDPAGSIAILDKVVEEEPTNRRALLLLTKATQNRAVSYILMENNRKDGYNMFLRSANVMRKLVESHENLTGEEKTWLGQALYNEACAYAEQGDPEKAIVALRKSVEAGYADAAHTEQDEDMATLREMPEYKEIIEEMKKN